MNDLVSFVHRARLFGKIKIDMTNSYFLFAWFTDNVCDSVMEKVA